MNTIQQSEKSKFLIVKKKIVVRLVCSPVNDARENLSITLADDTNPTEMTITGNYANKV